jgi:hypothetical protein
MLQRRHLFLEIQKQENRASSLLDPYLGCPSRTPKPDLQTRPSSQTLKPDPQARPPSQTSKPDPQARPSSQTLKPDPQARPSSQTLKPDLQARPPGQDLQAGPPSQTSKPDLQARPSKLDLRARPPTRLSCQDPRFNLISWILYWCCAIFMNHKLMRLAFGFRCTTLSLKSMPLDLLPASAGAFAPRSQTIVRLGSNAHSWLTTILKRIDKSIRCIRNVSQQVRHLKRILSSKNAIWTLCSVLIPKSPEADSLRSLNSALAIHCWRMIHVEAYIVYVDLETQDELAFEMKREGRQRVDTKE